MPASTSRSRRARRAPHDRQLRFLHAQPGAVPGRAGRGREGRAQRRARRGGHLSTRAGTHRDLAGAVHAERGRRVAAGDPGLRGEDSVARGVPRPPGHRPGVRGQGGPCEDADARQGFRRAPRRRGRLRGPALALQSHALPFARDRALELPRAARDHRVDRRRRDHGSPPSHAACRGRAVPSRVDPHRAWPRPARQFPEIHESLAMFTPQEAINRLCDKREIFYDEMVDLMRQVLEGKVTQVQFAAILMGLHVKTESVSEIAAAASVMREFSTKVDAAGVDHLVDTCGTGGDKAHTFNISTTAAFVAAAAGARVAKHGGRSVSSQSGSADVLESLGVNLALAPEQVSLCLREVGLGFMFAPSHHPAMKHAAPVRKELGMRTILNILGPLTNPAGAPNQVMGVFHSDLVGIQARVLKMLGSKHVMTVHGSDGLDEITLTGPTFVAELKHDFITEYTIEPKQFGIDTAPLEAIQVKDAADSRARVEAVLANEKGPSRDIVILN